VCFEKIAASIQSIIEKEFSVDEAVEVLSVKMKR
jgi:hypothetical protein